MTDVEKKNFRVQYKTIGLTYSRCPLSKVQVRDFLLSLSYPVEEYYIVQETHKEEKDCAFHIHVWFKFSAKPNIKTPKYFDVQGYHPNVKKASKNWIFNYLKKQDNNPLTNIDEGYVQLAKEGKINEAMEQFAFMHPKEFVINYDKVKKNISLLGKRKRTDHVYEFTGEVVDWDHDQKSLLVIGKSGCGKTEWAKSFVTHHLKKTYLRCTHIDSLKKYDGEDFIIWDDVSFSHMPRETQIHIAEVRNAREIHCRHACADIPPGICNIFLNNEYPFSLDQYGAIDRRLHRAPQIRFY